MEPSYAVTRRNGYQTEGRRPALRHRLKKKSLPIDMLLSAVSVLVVAQSSSEILEGLKNNPV
jgi:hypothetical protein